MDQGASVSYQATTLCLCGSHVCWQSGCITVKGVVDNGYNNIINNYDLANYVATRLSVALVDTFNDNKLKYHPSIYLCQICWQTFRLILISQVISNSTLYKQSRLKYSNRAFIN